MNEILNKKSIILYVLGTIFFHSFLLGQHIPVIKSPQTYEMEKYGNIPISLNTGSTSYSIDLFSYENIYNGKGINIGIKYFGTGFVPSKKSNYVGLDWSLDFGGVISREVRQRPDDFFPDSPQSNGNLYGYLHAAKNCNKTNNDIYNQNYQGLNAITGNSIGIKCGTYSHELEPDKFNFNFMGYSGYFFIGNDMMPIIVSDNKNLKIDLADMSARQPLNSLGNGSECLTKSSVIKITDENGIKYYFGGSYENLEISYNLLEKQESENAFVITGWNLYKVEYPNSNVIDIQYRTATINANDRNFCRDRRNIAIGTQEPFLLLFDHHHVLSQTISKENGQYNTSSGNLIYDGTIYWGSNSTSTDTSVIHRFSATKKSLPSSITLNGKTLVTFNFERFERYGTHTIPSLKLKDIFFYSTAGNVEKEINLNYYRHKDYFFLQNLKMFRKGKISLEYLQEYNFDYYNKEDLPDETTIGIDNWGYWNNRIAGKLIPNFTLNKNTDEYYFTENIRDSNNNLCSVGLLKSISYPTKGKSQFYYEPHKFSEKIDRTYGSQFKNQLVLSEGYVGGGRIAKIMNYSNDGLLAGTKEFKYISEFSPNGISIKSSGILSNYYRNLLYSLKQNSFETKEELNVYSDNIIETAMNSFPVLYSEVTEIESNKGYTKYFFTDYKQYPDSPEFKEVDNNLNPTNDIFKPDNIGNINLPYRSNNYKRGKQYKQEFYDENFNIVKSILTDFIDISAIKPDNYVTLSTTRLRSKYFFKLFGGSFDQASTTVKDFSNSNVLISKDEYFYQSANGTNLSKGKNIASDGTITETTYKYAHEKNNQALINANLVEIPLEVSITQESNGISKLVSQTENVYPDQSNYPNIQTGNLLLPLSAKSKDILNNSNYSEISYDLYDDKGNLLQYTNREGTPITILWGYEQMLPILKIEGITYSNLAAILGFANTNIGYKSLDIVVASNNDFSDNYETQTLIPMMDVLRQNVMLKNNKISTFTYDPQVGIKSITPPSGIREYYRYDLANRLEKIYDINDKIIKEYKYNFAPVTYFNNSQTKDFYKNDCPSWKVGGLYTYKVPENKYTSIISQDDADQKALDEINSNGQNMANLNGSCMFITCNFTPNYYVNMYHSSIQQTAPNHISIVMTFQPNPPAGMTYNSGSGMSVGYIDAACRPLTHKSINYTSSNSNWTINIDPSGYVMVKLNSGSIPPPNSPFGFSVEYDKN